jgi:hypothetical protein
MKIKYFDESIENHIKLLELFDFNLEIDYHFFSLRKRVINVMHNNQLVGKMIYEEIPKKMIDNKEIEISNKEEYLPISKKVPAIHLILDVDGIKCNCYNAFGVKNVFNGTVSNPGTDELIPFSISLTRIYSDLILGKNEDTRLTMCRTESNYPCFPFEYLNIKTPSNHYMYYRYGKKDVADRFVESYDDGNKKIIISNGFIFELNKVAFLFPEKFSDMLNSKTNAETIKEARSVIGSSLGELFFDKFVGQVFYQDDLKGKYKLLKPRD